MYQTADLGVETHNSDININFNITAVLKLPCTDLRHVDLGKF